jgi:hypothetical protein
MNWLKRNPLFGSALLLAAALLVMEAWLWAQARESARRALVALELKRAERDSLAGQSPALSPENEQTIARDLANTRQIVAALRSTLQGHDTGAPAGPLPAKSIDLYFDLAAFVEKARTLAAHAQVAVRSDECLGFGTYAHEGPADELVPAVYRQRVAGQYLVESLLAARPRSLLAVRRERPLTATQLAARNSSVPPGAVVPASPIATDGAAEDFFEFDEKLSMRVPGLVESDAFRLEFTGQTSALRELLNSLAAFKRPVIVRRVEVEPFHADPTSADPSAAPAVAGAPVPLVVRNLSRFAVIVEFLAFPNPPEPPAS